MHVSASIYPLMHFADAVIGQEFATLWQLMPPGVEPHDYEPTPRDVQLLQESALVIYNGGDIDAWVEQALETLPNIRTVRAMDTIAGDDPHVWLDPVLAQDIVRRIAEAMKATDPDHAQRYEENAQSYIAQLKQLDADMKTQLASCGDTPGITAHDAFGRLAERYNLRLIPIAGLSPDAEPSPKQVAELVQLARAEGIQTIFFEDLTSPALSHTIAQEVGAQTMALHTLEGLVPAQEQAGLTYLSLMRENLATLKSGLACP